MQNVDMYGRPTVDLYGRPIGYDGYGRPYLADAGPPPQAMVLPPGPAMPAPPGPTASAVLQQPNVAEMRGTTQPEWYRQAFFPTAPFYSTRQDVGYQVRYYSAGISSAAVNTEVLVPVSFDLPARLIALNGAAFSLGAGNALPVGVGPRDCFLFRMEYTTGDRLMISSRIASTVLGTSERPGELGATGYTIDQGATVQLGITPLLANLRIDITLHCLEMRGPRNFAQR